MTEGPQRAVVLLALGTPSDASVSAVRRFLRAFLGDKRVIALPWFFRKLLLETVILPFRAGRSAALYQKIWTPHGSPFSVNTEALRKRLCRLLGPGIPVFTVMRYGTPSAKELARKLAQSEIRELAVLPQFPQYAESSWETAVEHFSEVFKKYAPQIRLNILPPFYADSGYIRAVSEQLQGINRDSNFLFSFHGIPVKSLYRVAQGKAMHCDPASSIFNNKDCRECPAREKCYRRQCYATAEAIAEVAQIPRERVSVAFQSRFGRGRWLVPATAECPINANTVIVAPGFTTDNLETLLELRELNPGTLVPCLNDSPSFADFLATTAQRLLREPPHPAGN